ncbi:MAG: alpha-galactosidase, partial [Gorillibacterium sp.]|nr:alpha-galactosidase [Gorillibacterium sp.]
MKSEEIQIENKTMEIQLCTHSDNLLIYKVKSSGKTYSLTVPTVEIDGKDMLLQLADIRMASDPISLRNGSTEYRLEGVSILDDALTLGITLRVAPDNPVVRFQYQIWSRSGQKLTKSSGKDRLCYFKLSFAEFPQVKEVRFSEFIDMVHSFCLSELPLRPKDFINERNVMGPMLVGTDGNHSLLAAYEHGSQVPDAFIEFRLLPNREALLSAVKGNYLNRQSLNKERVFETVWFELAAIEGNEDQLAEHYRRFILEDMSNNLESRKPYIFYNTWNLQERTKHWYKGKFLDAMNQARVLQEIETAHEMGVEVFVIDAGWFEKTGDWRVSQARFPDGMRVVKERLDAYGMKLGLWFEPTSAALSSQMAKKCSNDIMARGGSLVTPRPVWETEDSYYMCLVSDYADAFADELIRWD